MTLRQLAPAFVLLLAGCTGGRETRWTSVAEGDSWAVASPVAERLVELRVREGDTVRKGDVLGRIDTTVLELQIAGLKEKSLQLEIQGSDLEGQLAVARDAAALARSTLGRYRSLGGEEGVSRQTLDELTLKTEQAESMVRSLELRQKTLSSQREEVSLQIRLLEESVNRALLTAPADGLVDRIWYQPGEYVPALRPVLDVVDLSKLWCMIYVPEQRLADLGPETTFTLKAGDSSLDGRIVHVNARAEFTPRELLTPDNRQAMAWGIKIGFENNDGVVKIGMPMDILLDGAGN